MKVSIDRSTHQDRRGFPDGAIVCCDCLVSARVVTFETPSRNARAKYQSITLHVKKNYPIFPAICIGPAPGRDYVGLAEAIARGAVPSPWWPWPLA